MVRAITSSSKAVNVPGVHFCTLNLEKSVRTVLENMGWTAARAAAKGASNGQSLLSATRPADGSVPAPAARNRLIEADASNVPASVVLSGSPNDRHTLLSISPSEASYLAQKEFQNHQRRLSLMSGERPPKPVDDGTTALPHPPAPGPGQPTTGAPTGVNTGGGVEDSWDEYPNGRFTDVRSPAYGEIDGWGNGLKITVGSEVRR